MAAGWRRHRDGNPHSAALIKPELEAVLDLPWNWQIFERANDPTIYHRGEIEANGRKRDIIAAACPRMSMIAAGVLSMKMITAFRPKYIGMAGILAGVRHECEIGDIIVADPCWDWGSGKYVRKGTQLFSAAPHQIGLSSSIRSKLAIMSQDGALLDGIRRAWRGSEPTTPLRMKVGPVASGASVLEDEQITERIKGQHRKLIGIDMETYGLFAAADESPLPQPFAFSIKSVSDFADPEKGDAFQRYAAYTSATSLQLFVERFL